MDVDVDGNYEGGNAVTAGCTIAVALKWSKVVMNFEIEVPPLQSPSAQSGKRITGRSFKDTVYSLTQVPIDRQKIMVTPKGSSKLVKWWKGILKDDFDFGAAIASANITATNRVDLKVTLIGTAEVLKPVNQTTTFLEDMTDTQRNEIEQRRMDEAMENVEAMIPALQFPPQDRQNPISSDGGSAEVLTIVSDFEEMKAYDRLVNGYSQPRIDALLRQQRINESTSNEIQLLGRTVLTMGLELQRAYVNDLCVLKTDGTLISGLDNGHINMWKHCRRLCDVIHEPSPVLFNSSTVFSGVDSVVALENTGIPNQAFCTAGRGCIRIWNGDGDPLAEILSPPPMNSAAQFVSPTDLVQIPIHGIADDNETSIICLASRFRVLLPASSRPRLVPQDEAGRQRVAEIEAYEIQRTSYLERMKNTVHVHFAEATVGQKMLVGATMIHSSAPITAISSWKHGNKVILAVGDVRGGILFQEVSIARVSSKAHVTHRSQSRVHFVSNTTEESRSAIVSLKYDTIRKQLWVSTKESPPTIATPDTDRPSSGDGVPSHRIPLKSSEGVHLIDVDSILKNQTTINGQYESIPLVSLNSHKSAVHCILPLPNGDLLTVGDKHDATTQVWSRRELEKAINIDGNQVDRAPVLLTNAATSNLCKDAGYVFGVEVIEDFKRKNQNSEETGRESAPFAIAVARYNVVKLIL